MQVERSVIQCVILYKNSEKGLKICLHKDACIRRATNNMCLSERAMNAIETVQKVTLTW